MALVLAALRVLLGGFFALTGAAKLWQLSAPESEQMVSGAAGPGRGRCVLGLAALAESLRATCLPARLPWSQG